MANTRQSLMKDQSLSNMSETKVSGLGHSIQVRDVDDIASPANLKEKNKEVGHGSSAYLNIMDTESNPNLTASQIELLTGQNAAYPLTQS